MFVRKEEVVSHVAVKQIPRFPCPAIGISYKRP